MAQVSFHDDTEEELKVPTRPYAAKQMMHEYTVPKVLEDNSPKVLPKPVPRTVNMVPCEAGLGWQEVATGSAIVFVVIHLPPTRRNVLRERENHT